MQNDIYREISRIQDDGEEAALATVTYASGSTPREEGAKMLVRADGSIMGTIGGGSVEFQVIKEAIEVIQRCRPRNFKYALKEGEDLGMICGGDIEVFIEPIVPSPGMFILGGGHISLSLAKMGKMAGFKITVVDNRPEYANAERFPDAEETLVSDYKTAMSKLKTNKNSYIIIVTHGHKGDVDALEGALETDARYIGMIGSKTKNEVVYTKLKAKGVTQEQLNRVFAPIGLPIHAQTPGEIAVSILAEIIKVRRED